MKVAGARVLIVEDDAVMRTFMENSLRRMGIHSIETCVDGLSALTLLAKFKPDLILTDVHMQPMGGLEFVKKLRSASNAAVKNIKVIFMSADASAETIGEALPLGILGYIVKPPRLEALRAKMEQALGS
ncbi:response regulator [Rhodoferax sp.]|uniref:response regulator n=1 Tax=Rhodoferax sp. TaxID=50421 RepID=UPI001EC10793|nr:response regulator [Rhodoferax sp.]MBT9507508.1 response regulator [Rhodoferax sp.]